MRQIYLVLTFIECSLSYSISSWAHEIHNPKEVTMCLTFEKVYDIDFKNQDYQIDFWCALTVLKKKYFDFRNQLQVVDSKKNRDHHGRFYFIA